MRVRVRIAIRPRPPWSRCHRDESGAVMAVVALTFTAFMGMTVLVVDVGGLLTLRRQLVTAADSAALAAAQSCALNDGAGAPTQADLLATSNQGDATRTAYQTDACGTGSSGSVELTYESPKELVFAPLLGAPQSRPVSASATAVWGPTGGVSPVPIEFSVDSSGQIPCAFQDIGTQCNYWHDNSADNDLSNSSNWGFMNLASAGAGSGDACPNSGSADRGDWISGARRAPIQIGPDGFTYVCVDSGHAASNWYDALTAQVGKIKYFPVNDPARMVRTSGREKYAIIGFVALRIDEVLKGNDPAAVGTPGSSGSCSGTHSFVPNGRFDVDTMGCYPTPPD
ncbi:MAG: pilus assembly protein TadG-related protein, partial [Actinomycetota bacterium]|nr:pilus assembly protein TadG-related protein [Actinomycetota bacterium]